MKTLFKTTSRAALVAIAVAAPVAAPVSAIAQEAQGEAQTGQGTDPMLMPEDGTGAGDGMAEGTPGDDPMGSEAATEDMNAGAADAPAKPVEGQITLQEDGTMLADDLLGAPVYNQSDEKVGSINDLIIAMSGEVEGVVIGVGGFLGLGEKDVAVQMSTLDVVETEPGSPRLVTSATKTDLESAPEFVTSAQQAREAEALRMQDDTGGAGSGTGTGMETGTGSGMSSEDPVQ